MQGLGSGIGIDVKACVDIEHCYRFGRMFDKSAKAFLTLPQTTLRKFGSNGVRHPVPDGAEQRHRALVNMRLGAMVNTKRPGIVALGPQHHDQLRADLESVHCPVLGISKRAG